MMPIQSSTRKATIGGVPKRRHSDNSIRLKNYVNLVIAASNHHKTNTVNKMGLEVPRSAAVQNAAKASNKKRQLKLNIDVDPIDIRSQDIRQANKPDVRDAAASVDTGISRLSMENIEEDINKKKEGPANLASDVCLIQRVGHGASGTVYQGCYVPTLKIVAVKEMKVFEDSDRTMLMHELHALHENLCPIDDTGTLSWLFNHHENIGTIHPCPYIVSFYGAFANSAKHAVYLVMEYMDGGSLQDLVKPGGIVSESVLWRISYCVFEALAHMHESGMLHRDIKPANILFNHYGQFKVSDFGLAGTVSKSKSFMSEFKGTVMYMSPERIVGGTYSYPSDIWAAGLSIFTLALGTYPFASGDGFFGLEESVVNEALPPMPLRYSSEFRDFIHQLLEKDPEKRLTAKGALLHPFIKPINTPTTDLDNEFAQDWKAVYVQKETNSDVLQLVCSKVTHSLAESIHEQFKDTSSTISRIKNLLHISRQEIDQFPRKNVAELAKDLNLPFSTVWNPLDNDRTMMNAILAESLARHMGNTGDCSLCKCT